MTAVNISPLPHFLATIRRHEQPFVCIVSLVCLKDRGGGDFSIGSDVHLLPLARWTHRRCGLVLEEARRGHHSNSRTTRGQAPLLHQPSRALGRTPPIFLRTRRPPSVLSSPGGLRLARRSVGTGNAGSYLHPAPHSFDDPDARAGRIADDRYANHDVGASCSLTSSVTDCPRRYASTTTSNISITTTPTGYSVTRRQRPWANATVGVRSDSTSTLLQMIESRTGRSNIWSSKWLQMGQTDAGTLRSVTKRGPGPMYGAVCRVSMSAALQCGHAGPVVMANGDMREPANE
jgi:hypothetical protein